MSFIDYVTSNQPKHKAVAVIAGCLAVASVIYSVTTFLSQSWAAAVLIVSMVFNWSSIRFSWFPGHKEMVKLYQMISTHYDILAGFFYLTFIAVGCYAGEVQGFSVSYGIILMAYCVSDFMLYFTLDDRIDHPHP